MKKILNLLIICYFLMAHNSYAADKWIFTKTYETPKLSERPVRFVNVADLKRDGKKEILVGYLGEIDDRDYNGSLSYSAGYEFYIFEWTNNQLKAEVEKKWKAEDMRSRLIDYSYYVQYMMIWDIQRRTIAETFPPLFAVEWKNGHYDFLEQNNKQSVRSWVFPWQSASCDNFTRESFPEECLYGIRNFIPGQGLKLLTLTRFGKGSKNTLKIRSSEPGFPVEFEDKSQERKFIYKSFGRFSKNAKSGILLKNFTDGFFYKVTADDKDKYKILKTNIKDLKIETGGAEISILDLYIGLTRTHDIEEYWGYVLERIADGGNVPILGRVVMKSDLSGIDFKKIDFPHNKPFLGIGYFDIQDIDGDGLDEVIAVEQTGKRKFGIEYVLYTQTKDYIKILKWNGKEYEVKWESPPYAYRGTKFVVEDIKGTGKKELIVLTREGTIQIWERQ